MTPIRFWGWLALTLASVMVVASGTAFAHGLWLRACTGRGYDLQGGGRGDRTGRMARRAAVATPRAPTPSADVLALPPLCGPDPGHRDGCSQPVSEAGGGSFALLLNASGLRGGVESGLVYGFAWWILGPLTLMPFFMGMGLGVNWNVAAMGQAMPSLMGHLIFGVILGVTYRWLQNRAGEPSVSGQTQAA